MSKDAIIRNNTAAFLWAGTQRRTVFIIDFLCRFIKRLKPLSVSWSCRWIGVDWNSWTANGLEQVMNVSVSVSRLTVWNRYDKLLHPVKQKREMLESNSPRNNRIVESDASPQCPPIFMVSVIEALLFNQPLAFNNKTQNNKSALLPMPQKLMPKWPVNTIAPIRQHPHTHHLVHDTPVMNGFFHHCTIA